MSKKYLKINISFIIIIISVTGYVFCHNSNFVKRNFIKLTNVKEYSVLEEMFDDHQTFIIAKISDNDKKELLKKFKFEVTLTKLKGKVKSPFISEEDDYLYYINDDDGQYGYIIFALEKEGNTLKVYELYGN